MTQRTFTRRLSAILSADAVGYSRLMRDDEEATVRTLTTFRAAMTHMIQQYRGRVVDSPGDNLLAEFGSVVDAVNCAVEIQRELAERNAELPENRRMPFRIGINLGDVLEEGGSIYGDGVNVAARMESLADTGGICLSGTVYDAVESKIGLEYEFLGEHEVKNIDKPIRAYRVLSFPGAAAHRVLKAKRAAGKTWRKAALVVGAVLIAATALAYWQLYQRPPDVEPASVDKMAQPLPDKPSIAVLPFANMSDDPMQEYFGDGISEEIITALSKSPKLLVIARNSTFSYKGKPVKVKQVAEDLGVRYVLEGSVRKSGNRIRVTAQLIDALSGHHLWAERYDRELKDIFALQDEITIKIVGALRLELTDGELARFAVRGTKNLEAYLLLLRGRELFYTLTKEGVARSRELFLKAAELDPGYPTAYLLVGAGHWLDIIIGASKSPKDSMALAFKYIKKTLALDDSLSPAHAQMGWLLLITGKYDQALAECQRALGLAPGSADACIWTAMVLRFSGRHQEAVKYAERALRLDPLPPHWYYWLLGVLHSWLGRHDQGIALLQKALRGAPRYVATHRGLTVAYVFSGQIEKARAQAAEALKLDPTYSLEQAARLPAFRLAADRERLLDALRLAGIPEHPAPPLPDKPSIAVLPFANMSGDPKREFWADGLSEGIITSVSKIPDLFVIARTSSFKYKGKPVDVRRVGRELGVKYILEGSIQKAGGDLRATAQLIEADTGRHLWAEKYQIREKDFFVVQDRIVMQVIKSLMIKLTEGERLRLTKQNRPLNLKALEKYLEAITYIRALNRESNNVGRALLNEALTLFPDYADACALLAATHVMDVWLGASASPRDSLMKAMGLAKKSIALDETTAFAHALLGQIYVMMRQYDKALAEGRQALETNPNSDVARVWLGMTLDFSGKCGEAIAMHKQAIRLCPFPPAYFYMGLGHALRSAGEYEKAVAQYQKTLSLTPDNALALTALAMCYGLLDRADEARAVREKILRLNPGFSSRSYVARMPYRDQAMNEKLLTGLRKAGLPE